MTQPSVGSARERILDAAERLVLARGFAATTVDAVLKEAATSKGAFFHHFPSKAALGHAVVERYATRDLAALDEALAASERHSDDPGEQLVALIRWFEDAADEMVDVQPGCLFVSFIYESQLDDAATAGVVAETILQWRARILEKLEQAVTSRRRLAEVDLPSLADHVFTTFEGAFLLVRALDDAGCMRRQLAHLRRYLELLLVDDVPVPRRRRAASA